MFFSTEVFTRLKPFPLYNRPGSLHNTKRLKVLDKARVKEWTSTTALHKALDQVHKGVAEGKCHMLHGNARDTQRSNKSFAAKRHDRCLRYKTTHARK